MATQAELNAPRDPQRDAIAQALLANDRTPGYTSPGGPGIPLEYDSTGRNTWMPDPASVKAQQGPPGGWQWNDIGVTYDKDLGQYFSPYDLIPLNPPMSERPVWTEQMMNDFYAPYGGPTYTSQQNPGTGNAATYMGQYPAGEPLIGMNGPGQGYQPVPLGMEVPLQSGGTAPATQEMIDNFNSYHMTQQMLDDYNNAMGITANVPQPAGSPGGAGGPSLFPNPLNPGFSNTGNLQDQNLAGQTPTNNNIGLGLTPSDMSGQIGAQQPPTQPAAMGGLAQQAAGGGTPVNPYQGYAPPAPMGGGNSLLQQSEQDLQQPAQGGIYSGFQ